MEQPKVNTNFEFNGATYYFDAEDVDCMERYAEAAEKMAEKSEQISTMQGGSLREKLQIQRIYCESVRGFFDDIFGEGAGIALCGERMNSRTDSEVYAAFVDFARAQAAAGSAFRASIADAYLGRSDKRSAAVRKP